MEENGSGCWIVEEILQNPYNKGLQLLGFGYLYHGFPFYVSQLNP